jgi:hypothetical protein
MGFSAISSWTGHILFSWCVAWVVLAFVLRRFTCRYDENGMTRILLAMANNIKKRIALLQKKRRVFAG